MWVKPSVTTTYVVRQILDCSSEKWDTVVVYMNPLGIDPSTGSGYSSELKIYPVPASDFLEISVSNSQLLSDFKTLSIYNCLGQLIRQEEINFEKNKVSINTIDLQNGLYLIQLKNSKNELIRKKFIIKK